MRCAPWLAAFLFLHGCVSYSGGAQPIDPSRLTTEPGWIVVGHTPELRQRSQNDCGAAALAMIAGHWSLPLSVEAASAALPTATEQGVRLGDLRDVARAHGLAAFALTGDHETLVHELRAGRPVIVGLLLPYGGKRVQSHYEVVVAMQPAEGQIATIDPARGLRARSWADLDAEWRPASRPMLIVLGPVPSK